MIQGFVKPVGFSSTVIMSINSIDNDKINNLKNIGTSLFLNLQYENSHFLSEIISVFDKNGNKYVVDIHNNIIILNKDYIDNICFLLCKKNDVEHNCLRVNNLHIEDKYQYYLFSHNKIIKKEDVFIDELKKVIDNINLSNIDIIFINKKMYELL